jgi:hypothetical protein
MKIVFQNDIKLRNLIELEKRLGRFNEFRFWYNKNVSNYKIFNI